MAETPSFAETQSFADDIRRYMALVWHWAWLLVLAMGLAAGVAFVVSDQMAPVYQASTTMLIQQPTTPSATDYTALQASERLARTYAQMITKDPILQAVIDSLGLPVSISQLAAKVDVVLVRDTQLIDVLVEDTDPDRAAQIANALVAEFAAQNQALQSERYQASKANLEKQLAALDVQIEQVIGSLAQLETQPDSAEKSRQEALLAQYRQTYSSLLEGYENIRLVEAQSTSSVVALEMARSPNTPIRPRVMQNTLLAVVVGLMLGLGVVFLVDALDDRLRTPEQITSALGLPVLGIIAHIEAENELPVTLTHPRSPVAEAYRSLRTNIQFASVDMPVHSLLVTSPEPSDGKSTTAINLAVVMAQCEHPVVLVDADMRRPSLHKVMRISNRRGISDLFIQPQVYLDGSLKPTNEPNLSVLTSGNLPPNPSELLGSEKMSQVIRHLRETVDTVILDTPPVLAVTDAVVLSPRVDGVLIVVRPGITHMTMLRQTVAQLQRVGARILGVALNDVNLKRSRYYYGYKGYYANYAYELPTMRMNMVRRKRNTKHSPCHRL
jgi:non-specific protein-tyrosine kinase